MHLRAMYRHAHGNYGSQAERDHSLSKALPWMHVCTEVAVWVRVRDWQGRQLRPVDRRRQQTRPLRIYLLWTQVEASVAPLKPKSCAS